MRLSLHIFPKYDHSDLDAKDEGQLSADSVEKVGFSNLKISRLIVSSEPVHHIAWLFGSALIDAARSMG